MSVILVKHTVKRDAWGETLHIPAHKHCRKCGSNNVVTLHVPGRAMGGAWIPGTDMSDCNYCGARTMNAPKGV
jgi:ribosomal protein L37E